MLKHEWRGGRCHYVMLHWGAGGVGGGHRGRGNAKVVQGAQARGLGGKGELGYMLHHWVRVG